MTADERTDELRTIISSILQRGLPKDDNLVSMIGIPEWDSMAHVQIVVAIEKRFGVEADLALVEAQDLLSLDRALANLVLA